MGLVALKGKGEVKLDIIKGIQGASVGTCIRVPDHSAHGIGDKGLWILLFILLSMILF